VLQLKQVKIKERFFLKIAYSSLCKNIQTQNSFFLKKKKAAALGGRLHFEELKAVSWKLE